MRDAAMTDPIAAIATALRPAALGIVRASGSGTLERLSAFFSRPKALAAVERRGLVHGWILDPETRAPLDEVVAAVYRAPSGFTGEDAAEVICHGGPAVVTAVFSAFLNAGFRQAEPGEFSLRAFASGKTDLTRAEAASEIISAKTAEARKKAAARLAGSVEKAFAAIRAKVIKAAAAIAAEIEYPEDEDVVKGAFDASLVKSAADDLAALESTWAVERLYQNGAEAVIAGATNAGKSRLFNLMLKEERSIVSDAHGTTRDWIEAEVDFSGIPVRLFDTAGLRQAESPIEAEGIARSRGLIRRADAVLYVVDSTRGFSQEDSGFFAEHGRLCGEEGASLSAPIFIAWNKIDLPESLPKEAVPKDIASLEAVKGVFPLSAKSGEGLEELAKSVCREFFSRTETVSAEAALGSLRQKKAAERAGAFLRSALQNAESGFPLDVVAQDLDDALFALGEVTGETASADILDEVFSSFCVGK